MRVHNTPHGKFTGGYPIGRHGAYSRRCGDCGANPGSRCVKVRRDSQGREYPIGRLAVPHAIRRQEDTHDRHNPAA